MKNRIDLKFEQLKQEGKKAFIPFITAGDPDLDTTIELVLEMEKQGADLVELGVSFTDPMAEGPVIQAANLRALQHDVCIDCLFEMVQKLRQSSQIPIVFLMYYNSLLHYGAEPFFAGCAKVGVDGIIVPDLPYEESDEIEEYTNKYNVYQISLVAPTSLERMKGIIAKSKGFLYCVSSLGVTGMRDHINTDLNEFFHNIQTYSTIPNCIGFGISTPELAAEVKQYCDGVIVGSAIVNRIANGKTKEEKITSVGEFVGNMCKAVK